MSRFPFVVRVLGALALFATLLVPLTASAHEAVACGTYTCEIGWTNEPVIVGQPNSLELFIAPSDNPEEGVAEVATTLKFTVEYGGQSQAYDLVPAEEKAGAYTARFIPTRAGQYTFHLTGTIKDEAIDVKVEPEEVVTAGQFAFPEALPSVRELSDQLTAAQAQARAAQSLAIVGVVLGALGLGLGAWAVLKKK